MALEKDLLTPALTAIVVGIGTVVTQKLNRRHGRKNEAAKKGELSGVESAIKDSHAEIKGDVRGLREEIKAEVRELRDTLTLRIDEIGACAEDAQRTATKALHASVGINGENGTRGDQRRIEKRLDRFEEEVRRDIADIRRTG